MLPRKSNDLELAQRCTARRLAGFMLESHYSCTADRTTLVNESKLPYWMSTAREMRALGIAGWFLNVTQDGQVTPAIANVQTTLKASTDHPIFGGQVR